MRVVVQRVNEASVEIDGKIKSSIAIGLMVLVGIEEAIGKSRRTVARQIKQLQEDRVIRRVGSDKTGYWEVIG
jgi:D-Tyr-tRNAtyr deacylase